jgi:hypothetical protein
MLPSNGIFRFNRLSGPLHSLPLLRPSEPLKTLMFLTYRNERNKQPAKAARTIENFSETTPHQVQQITVETRKNSFLFARY